MSKDPSQFTRDIINSGLAGFGQKPKPATYSGVNRMASWPSTGWRSNSFTTPPVSYAPPPPIEMPPPRIDKEAEELPEWVEYRIPMTKREATLYLGTRCSPCVDPECSTCKGWDEWEENKCVTVLFRRESLVEGVLGGLV